MGRIFATSFEAGCNSNFELYSQGLSRVFANIRNLVLQRFAGILAAGSGAGCNSNFELNSYGLFRVFANIRKDINLYSQGHQPVFARISTFIRKDVKLYSQG